MIPSSRSKLSDLYTLSHSKLLENHILHSGTYLYSPYMAVPLRELGLVPWSFIFPYLNTLLSMNINVVEWITLKRIWHNISNVYLRTAWLAMWLVGRLTQKSVAVEGPKEFPNCSALTLRIRISLSHSSLYGKTTVWLLHMNWPISIF